MEYERCTKHTVKVFGGESRQYTVSVKDIFPTCTCMSFVMNRNRALSKDPEKQEKYKAWCKHIEAQINNLCYWRGEPGMIPGICPKCTSPTEPFTIDEEL